MTHEHKPALHHDETPVKFEVRRVSKQNDVPVCAHLYLCVDCGVLYAPANELRDWKRK